MSSTSSKTPENVVEEGPTKPKDQSTPLHAPRLMRSEEIKRLLYKWIFLLALIASMSALCIRIYFEDLTRVDLILLPKLSLCFLSAMVTSWRFPQHIETMERALFRVMEVYFFVRIIDSFFFMPAGIKRATAFNDIMPWLGVFILYGFWVFERRRALIEVGIFVGGGVCLAIGFLATSNAQPVNYRLVFQQMLLANIAYAWIAYLFAWMVEAYGRENAKATMMQKMALTDPLTGVANRRQMELLLDDYAGKDNFGLLLLDLDHFKQVNDKHGHQIGDRVLVAAAEAMKASLRAEEALGRWGGEEFLILLPKVGLKEARKIAERLRKAVAKQGTPGGPPITTSVGVVHGSQANDRNTLLQLVDKALYQAKENGRDQVVCWVGDEQLY